MTTIKPFTLPYTLLIGCFMLSSITLMAQQDSTIFLQNNFSKLRFAHRGGYEFGPENTIPTIVQNIKEHKANALEIDIQLTQDGQLVVFHDETIERLLTTNQKKKINELTLKQLQEIPIRGSQGKLRVPTLDEVVDTLAAMVLNENYNFMVELDFKASGNTVHAVNELVTIVEKRETLLGDNIYNYFFVSSFFPDVLKAIRKRSNKIITAFAVNNKPDKKKLLAKIAILFSKSIVRKNKAIIIEPNQCMVTKRFVKKWTKRGVLINTFTANGQCEKEYLNQFPVAYTTNCPNHYCETDPTDLISKKTKWCKKCR